MAVVYAIGTLTNAGADFANADTVTIGGKVYTMDSALSNTDGHVKIGASAAATLTNLFNAINAVGGGVPGTDYALVMTANPEVVATNPTATTVKVWAKTPGTVGNFIPTVKTSAGGAAWGGATLASGTGSLYADVKTYIATSAQLGGQTWQQLIDWSDPTNIG